MTPEIKRLKDLIEQRAIKMKERIASIPKIHWEILRYSNTHNKEQCLVEYPEHSDFINTITFNS